MAIGLRFYIWRIMTVYYKMRQILLQNAVAISLQNATEFYYRMRQIFLLQKTVLLKNCDSYYKIRQFYYKMRQLSQNASLKFQSYLCKIIIQTISSLTVHDNLWAVKFDSFSKFQNVINDSTPGPRPDLLHSSIILTLCVRKSICDSPLSGSCNFAWI